MKHRVILVWICDDDPIVFLNDKVIIADYEEVSNKNYPAHLVAYQLAAALDIEVEEVEPPVVQEDHGTEIITWVCDKQDWTHADVIQWVRENVLSNSN